MAERTLTGEGSRRVFFYNPDAIGMWIYRKFQGKFVELEKRVQLRMKIHTAYPPGYAGMLWKYVYRTSAKRTWDYKIQKAGSSGRHSI